MIYGEDRMLNKYKDNYTVGLGGLPLIPSRIEGKLRSCASTPEPGLERSPLGWMGPVFFFFFVVVLVA